MNRVIYFFVFSLLFVSCGDTKQTVPEKKVEEKIIKQFGFTLNDYNVKTGKVKRGDSFGTILENNNLFYPQIYNIVQKVKKVYDIRKINIGKPYTILSSKDSLNTPQVFIYQPNLIDYVVVSLTDSLWAEKRSKAVELKEFEAKGVISSSLSETMEKQKLSLCLPMSFRKFMHGPLISLDSKKEIILKSFILQSSLMIQYLSVLTEFILLTLNIEANLFMQ